MHILPSQDSVVSQDSVECRTPQCLGQDSAVSQDSVVCWTPQCLGQDSTVFRSPWCAGLREFRNTSFFNSLEISSSVREMFTFKKRICYLIDP